MRRGVLVATWALAAGHSYLASPASRNLLASLKGEEDCPHCLQSGGPDNVKARGKGTWPTRLAPESHGLCGNPVQGQSNPVSLEDETYLKKGPITATYQPGQVVEFQVAVSTHHQGHYEFRICDRGLDFEMPWLSALEGQQCLDRWLLQRAEPLADCVVNDARGDCQPLDPKHPERWYLPPAGSQTQVAGNNFNDSMASSYPSSGEVHRMRYKIPEGLTCTSCTLQWYWSTGNSCYYDGDYIDYFQGIAAEGWDSEKWQPLVLQPWVSCENRCCNNETFAEEFWNCADIAVVSGGTTESTTATASTTAASTTAGTTSTTTLGASFAPVDGGEGRACRGATASDNAVSHYDVVSAESLEECKAKCVANQGCVGIEFSGKRCELWTRAAGIEASIPLNGFTCLRRAGLTTTAPPDMGTFLPVDGGQDRACRGASVNDNNPQHYTVHAASSLNSCKLKCAQSGGCVGIEFSATRCEVWSRKIEATKELPGFQCFSYAESETATTTSGTSMGCSKAWEACGGQNWDGPTCCESGYMCTEESIWYSQCRPPPEMIPEPEPEMPGLAQSQQKRRKRFRGTIMLQDGTEMSQALGDEPDEL